MISVPDLLLVYWLRYTTTGSLRFDVHHNANLQAFHRLEDVAVLAALIEFHAEVIGILFTQSTSIADKTVILHIYDCVDSPEAVNTVSLFLYRKLSASGKQLIEIDFQCIPPGQNLSIHQLSDSKETG